jgi:hypothetical protein
MSLVKQNFLEQDLICEICVEQEPADLLSVGQETGTSVSKS